METRCLESCTSPELDERHKKMAYHIYSAVKCGAWGRIVIPPRRSGRVHALCFVSQYSVGV